MNYWNYIMHDSEWADHIQFFKIMILITAIIFGWQYLVKKLIDRD